MPATIERSALAVMAISAALVGLAAALHFLGAGPIPNFAACALALAAIAHLIGEATDELGNYLGPAATGIVQSAVGNLPELFIAIFALQSGLVAVVQASLIGSILGNALLVLGLAFVMGGAKHGVLKFEGQAPRMMTLSAKGRVAAAGVNFEEIVVRQMLRREMLHAELQGAVYENFASGNYDTAVRDAFVQVEIAVREQAKLAATLVGVKLMREAFNPNTGKLTDTTLPVSERERIADLFVGAIGTGSSLRIGFLLPVVLAVVVVVVAPGFGDKAPRGRETRVAQAS